MNPDLIARLRQRAVGFDIYREAANALAELAGDLQLMKLSRDAKLCSQCPCTGELAALRAALIKYGRHYDQVDHVGSRYPCTYLRLAPPGFTHRGVCDCGLAEAIGPVAGRLALITDSA